jgi:hypothetical protein
MTGAPIQLEAMTLDEAAFRCRVSVEHFKRVYTGRKIRLGGSVRVSSYHLLEWMNEQADGARSLATANDWDEDDSEEANIQGR